MAAIEFTLLDAAIAHAAVGRDRGVDLRPRRDARLENQAAADHDVVVVGRHEEPAFRRAPPFVEDLCNAGSLQQPAGRAAG